MILLICSPGIFVHDDDTVNLFVGVFLGHPDGIVNLFGGSSLEPVILFRHCFRFQVSNEFVNSFASDGLPIRRYC